MSSNSNTAMLNPIKNKELNFWNINRLIGSSGTQKSIILILLVILIIQDSRYY